ncbi:unnamed protein product [Peronospora destructor]|uniref:Uncharacterized protein n=1 Tax=Peronospora destructor TaxID=86335 RepID=A0AAV0TFI0_9STRA|nr:unnamed protein product [Peronospora destructor]
MTRKKPHEMPPIHENEDGIQSSGDGVATEGEEEEEEEVVQMRNSTRKKDDDDDETPDLISEEGAEASEQLTSYVAKCYGHLETLRKRKREQEEQVETLVEETFGQIEIIMQEIMLGLQERHAASHAQFEATDTKLSRSLREHNRMDKKLKMIAAILLREEVTIDTVNSVDEDAPAKKECDYADESDDVDASDGESGEASSGTDGRGEAKDDDDKIAGTKASYKEELLEEVDDDALNDVAGSCIFDCSHSYIYFNQWKRKLNGKSTVTRLRLAFEQLLPRLLGARDYAGAAKVLGVMYHRFALTPALCIEASLEILRRRSDYRSELLSFYEAALELHSRHVDKMLILKEMWLFHIAHGEFYEAYHMYRDKIEQMKEAEEDARLLANFGVLCYWLMFIESKELRKRFERKDTDYEEEDDYDLDATVCGDFDTCEDIESVIKSNYLFKTPIGVHVLYQHACNALRRAVAQNPDSAIFVEHYVQLLVLVGDVQPACDYLEVFFHMNPDDPHGSRMLAQFLERYYPDSVDAQVTALSRWMKNDPSCRYPLEKMLELSSAGVVSSFLLTKVLVEVLDTCGSDLYVKQNPDMALASWRNLAELLVAMDEAEYFMDQVKGEAADPLNHETIADVGTQHAWWKRVYLARPSTIEDVIAVAKSDSIFLEVSIYRAAVSHRLFPGQLLMVEAMRSAMAVPDVAFSDKYVRLFKSFFPSVSSTTTNKVAHTSFSDMPFMLVAEDVKKKELPNFIGSSNTVHVMDRRCIVEREAASEQATVVATRTGTPKEVDQQFVQELYEALESEVGLLNMNDRRSQRKRKADAISTSAAPALIPGFVGMVEEEVYNNPQATVQHIYSMIHQKLRRSDMLVPTSIVVAHCVGYFRSRLEKNVETYGHGGLMMRYDEFIATYLRRQRAKGVFEVTKDGAKAAVDAMQCVLPSSHPHFPDVNVVEETMRIKTAMFVRQRRLRLMDLKQMLRPVLKKIVYVDEKTFVDAVYSVCKRNGLFGVVTRTDIARLLQNILPMHYYKVLQNMSTRSMRLLTSLEFRKDCNTLEEVLNKLKKVNSPRTTKEVKALLWVERYEALYGPILDDEEDSVEESNSDTRAAAAAIPAAAVVSAPAVIPAAAAAAIPAAAAVIPAAAVCASESSTESVSHSDRSSDLDEENQDSSDRSGDLDEEKQDSSESDYT